MAAKENLISTMEWKREHWIMNYFTMINNIARCNFCAFPNRHNETRHVQEITMFQNLDNFLQHIKSEHLDRWNEGELNDNNWKTYLWTSYFYISENDVAQCLFCTQTYVPEVNVLRQLKEHLVNTHMFTRYSYPRSDRLVLNWINNNYDLTPATNRLYDKKCNTCATVFPNDTLPQDLLSHLIIGDNLNLPDGLLFVPKPTKFL